MKKEKTQDYADRYFKEVEQIAKTIDLQLIEKMVQIILSVKNKKGRLFFIGVGGSAANCTHAVNDFRKIGGIECYTPCDNVAEVTARTNDEGWDSVFAPWLECSHLNDKDAIFCFSVGGGSKEKLVSVNLIHALDYAKKVGASIMAITGRNGGFAGKVADACLIIPSQSGDGI